MQTGYVICTCLLLMVVLSACATTGSKTGSIGQAQLKNFETRSVDASFDVVFSAATEALFDLGYTIKHSDKPSGIILGEKQDARKDDKAVMAFLFGFAAANYISPTVYNLTIYIKPIDQQTTDIRIKTTTDGEPILHKQAIDKVWVYIDRQVLMESPPSLLVQNVGAGQVVHLVKQQGAPPIKQQQNVPSLKNEQVNNPIVTDGRQQVSPREQRPVDEKVINSEEHLHKTNNPEALTWLDKSYQCAHDGQWAESIRTASVAIILDPGLENAYVNRAWAYNEKGFYEKAINDCNQALMLSPENAAAINNRGLAYQRMEQEEKAVQEYRTACELGLDVSCNNFREIAGYLPSEEINFFLKQSVESFSAGDYDDVLAVTSKVIEIDAYNAEAYSTRCAAEINNGQLQEAKRDCRKSIECDPDFSMAYNNLGYLLELEGDAKEATLYYEMRCGLGNNLACNNKKKLVFPDVTGTLK